MKISSLLKTSMFPASLLQLKGTHLFSNILYQNVGAGQDGLAAETEQPMAGYPSVSDKKHLGKAWWWPGFWNSGALSVPGKRTYH